MAPAVRRLTWAPSVQRCYRAGSSHWELIADSDTRHAGECRPQFDSSHAAVPVPGVHLSGVEMFTFRFALVCAIALTLVACGGGGGRVAAPMRPAPVGPARIRGV